MKAHADNLTKRRWFRALTTLGQALRRPHCASPVGGSCVRTEPANPRSTALIVLNSQNGPLYAMGDPLFNKPAPFLRCRVALVVGVLYGVSCGGIIKLEAASSDSKQPVPVSVRGKVQEELFFGFSKGKLESTFELTINDKGECYIICHPTPQQGLVSSAVTHWEYFYDGLSSFVRSSNDPNYSPTQIIKRTSTGELVPMAVERKMKLSNHANLIVQDGPAPAYNNDSIITAWVTYCLPYMLGTSISLEHKPLYYMGPAYQVFDLKLSTHISGGKEGFASLLQMHPAERFLVNPTNSSLARLPLEELNGKSYTNLFVQVLAWTNVNQIAIPVDTVAYVWVPVPPDHKVTLVKQFQLRAEQIIVGSKANNQLGFAAVQKTMVTESRSRISGLKIPFTYLAQDGRVLGSSELKQLDAYNQFVSTLKEDKFIPNSKQRLFKVLIIILFVLLIPMGLTMLRKWASPETRKKHEASA